MNIERAYRNSWGELIDVWDASVKATHDFLHPDDIDYYRKIILEQYFDAVTLYCIKDANDKIAAFAGVSEDMLEMLFIRPDMRGKGLGKALTEFVIHTLNIYLVDVNEENLQAVGFYKKLGYQVTGRSEVDSENKNYPILHMDYRIK